MVARNALPIAAVLFFSFSSFWVYGQEMTQTPSPAFTPTPTPLVLEYNPDLDDNGEVDPSDLLLLIRAWQVRNLLYPEPTPAFAPILGFVVSASTNLGVASATLVAGTEYTLSSVANGFFRLANVPTDATTLLVRKDGFETYEEPISYPFTNRIVSLLPPGFPTPTPTDSPTSPSTPTQTATPSPDPSLSETPTATGTDTPTETPTETLPPTATWTRTPTPSPTWTATPVPIVGTWEGELNGVILVGSDIVWVVVDSSQAVATARGLDYTGFYSFTSSSRVRFDGVSGTETILLEMTWNGADAFTDGEYDITFPDPGDPGSSLSDTGTFGLVRTAR